MPFTQQALDFLFENRIKDSREWFKAHKADFERLVRTPMIELLERLAPAMLDIDPLLNCAPKSCISRIYRDTRFAKDKSIYRDVMWCSFMRDKKIYNGLPGFYVEISPCGFQYGCGYYQASRESMEAMREMIRAGDKVFENARRAYDKQSMFKLEDTKYKRTRNADQPEALREWLDQRSLCANAASTDIETMLSDGFAEKLSADFARIAPLYTFMITAESRKAH